MTDTIAFERLVAEHRNELYAHCYRMLGSVQDAEDALQEAMLRAWKGLPRFEGRSSLRSWLYTISTNTCLKAIEQHDAQVGAFLLVDRDGALAQAEAVDRRRRAGETLSPLAGFPVAVKDVRSQGDLAVVRADYGPDGAEPVGQYVWTLERGAQGTWTLSWWIFNRKPPSSD